MVACMPSPARAAAFTPSAAEADPPTGAVGAPAVDASPDEPLRGPGIQWRLAPWRVGGTLALDLRSVTLEDGRRSSSLLQLGDIGFSSHIWQPWFIQVKLGVGWVASAADDGVGNANTSAVALTGRAALAVFPASRFPFELRADVSDSRASGAALVNDYRMHRIGLTQSYRPATGNTQLSLQIDRSTLSSDVSSDALTTISATALSQQGAHQWELALNRSDHERQDVAERTEINAAALRHGWNGVAGAGGGALQVQTLASWNESRLTSSNTAGSTFGGTFGSAYGSDVRQISTLLTWRGLAPLSPLLHGPPLVSGTVRLVDARAVGGAENARSQAFNASGGLSQDLSPSWRASLSGGFSRVRADSLAGPGSSETGRDTLATNGTINWAPQSLLLDRWRYAPNAALNVGLTRDEAAGASQESSVTRKLLGLQASHGLSREFPVDPGTAVSLTATQSAGALRESTQSTWLRAIAHGAGISWQSMSADGRQGYGGLSYTDARNFGPAEGRFQLINLQVSQRLQLSRQASAAAYFTAQATRNQASEIDVFSGERRTVGGEHWQPYLQGSASLENQRAFDVPRLRLSILLTASSQSFERRATGFQEAPPERVSESAEARLDYAVGKLDTRAALRWARVDGREITSIQARAQRRF
jgi:hypothetical protein